MNEDNNADVKLALDEMRLNMEKSISAGDALDQKVYTLLTAAGLIMAVTVTLQISLAPNHSDLYWGILIGLVVLYVGAIVFILRSSMPHTYRLPIKADWEELDSQLFGKGEREAILVMLSGYVAQISHNEALNKSKARLHTISFWLLIVIVVMLLGLTAIP